MNGYHLEWWKAVGAALVLSVTIWAAGRLVPGRKAAPFIGAVVGVALLILASYVSWALTHR